MQARLVSYNSGNIPVGGIAMLDGNYPVTVTAVRPPYDDGDTGKVTVRLGWGAVEDVDPVRLGAYIAA